MKIIIPFWQGRISPLFDAARAMLVVDMDNGRELSREIKELHSTDPLQRVRQTLNLGAGILICGAISGQLECMLRSSGLQVVSNICGGIDDVLNAFVDGSLYSMPFVIPGRHGLRRRSRNRRGSTFK